MIEQKRILAYIPARGGSKGVPHKNICLLGTKPLLAYTVEAACASKFIDYVLVSTDSELIAKTAQEYGAQTPFLRPAELASDTARNIDGVVHALGALADMDEHFDVVMVLQPTSPFRDEVDIDASLCFFVEHNCQGVVSVSEAQDHPILLRTMDEKTGELTRLLKVGSTVRRQDMPAYYKVDGAIAINATAEISSELSINDNPLGFLISHEHALEIDTIEDLENARDYLHRKLGENAGEK